MHTVQSICSNRIRQLYCLSIYVSCDMCTHDVSPHKYKTMSKYTDIVLVTKRNETNEELSRSSQYSIANIQENIKEKGLTKLFCHLDNLPLGIL